MAQVSDAYEAVADTDLWYQAGATFVGFLAPILAQNLIENSTSIDTYDELYGVGMVAAAEVAAPAYTREMQVGAGLYSIDQFSERVGAKAKLLNLSAGV
jgi:hypothetical protein